MIFVTQNVEHATHPSPTPPQCLPPPSSTQQLNFLAPLTSKRPSHPPQQTQLWPRPSCRVRFYWNNGKTAVAWTVTRGKIRVFLHKCVQLDEPHLIYTYQILWYCRNFKMTTKQFINILGHHWQTIFRFLLPPINHSDSLSKHTYVLALAAHCLWGLTLQTIYFKCVCMRACVPILTQALVGYSPFTIIITSERKRNVQRISILNFVTVSCFIMLCCILPL